MNKTTLKNILEELPQNLDKAQRIVETFNEVLLPYTYAGAKPIPEALAKALDNFQAALLKIDLDFDMDMLPVLTEAK